MENFLLPWSLIRGVGQASQVSYDISQLFFFKLASPGGHSRGFPNGHSTLGDDLR